MNIGHVDELLNLSVEYLKKHPTDEKSIMSEIDELLDLRLSLMQEKEPK